MKKIIIIVGIILASIGLVACGEDENQLEIVATAVPHSVILEEARGILLEQDIRLNIRVVNDFHTPNPAVANGSAHANFFQHIPFLERYNNDASERNQLVNVGAVHIEPLAGYSRRISNENEIIPFATPRQTVILSTSVADHGRVLYLMAQHQLIELTAGATRLSATLNDVVGDPFEFITVAPQALVTQYQNDAADLIFINGNFALTANLPSVDRIIAETATDNPFVNVVATRPELVNDRRIVALVEVLQSEHMRNFINQRFGGYVIPA